jgi:hypothetical protein
MPCTIAAMHSPRCSCRSACAKRRSQPFTLQPHLAFFFVNVLLAKLRPPLPMVALLLPSRQGSGHANCIATAACHGKQMPVVSSAHSLMSTTHALGPCAQVTDAVCKDVKKEDMHLGQLLLAFFAHHTAGARQAGHARLELACLQHQSHQ